MTDWKRVSRRRMCPICGKGDWCLYVGPDDAPDAALCQRIESPKQCGEAGFLHRLRNTEQRFSIPARRIEIEKPVAPSIDFDRLAAECVATIRPCTIQRLADSLGVTSDSLLRLSVGWSGKHAAFTFPMRSAESQVVGIRLRLANGKKLSIRGGKEGLFVPADLDVSKTLLVCEGPSDCAALLGLGFDTVGRPSCTGGTSHLIELMKSRKPQVVVIVADGDSPGLRGAMKLKLDLLPYTAVKLIVPSGGCKDAREWVRNGATAADVQEAIDRAITETMNIATKFNRKAVPRV